jgi:imidazolonepropionase-like amidohydrolase
VSVVAVRATVGWLGPGRLVDHPVVVFDGDVVVFAGAASPADTGVVVDDERGARSLSGRPVPGRVDQEIVLDGFLMPGAVDRHVHVGLSSPQAVVRGGVTAARDLGWPPDDVFSVAEASDGPSFDGPLIRAAGAMITCPGGYPTRASWAPTGTGLEVRGSDEAAKAGRWLLERGAAVLKVALNADAGPTLSDDELVAVCDVAHVEGTIVTAHVQGRGQAARALGAGVDEFAHGPWSERLPDDLVQAMARRMRIVSTLDIHSYGRDTPELRTATDNLRRFLAADGRVAYGTDLGNGPIPAGIHVGEAFHLYRAGLSPEGVLQALTFRPLAEGEPADLVVLGGNPLEDLSALGDLRLVVRGGRRFV